MTDGRRRLVVHIGHPKTGTSAIQTFLYANRELLSERGILYPRESDLIGSQHSLAREFEPGYRPPRDALTFAKLALQVEASDADAFVLSSEQWTARADQARAVRGIQEFAENVGLTVDVIAFVRPQHAYINSFYTELVKRFHEQRQFRAHSLEAVERPLLDYAAHLAEWDRPSNMRLVPLAFTRDALQPNLETAFFDAAGLSDRVGELLAGGGRFVNTAPGALAIEVCRRVAVDLASRSEVETNNRIRMRLSRTVLRLAKQRMDWDEAPYNGVDDGLRDQLDAPFSDSNRAFAQRYWGADWYETFSRDYEAGLIPNEFGGSGTTPRDRRAVANLTDAAISRVDQALEASSQARSDDRRPPVGTDSSTS